MKRYSSPLLGLGAGLLLAATSCINMTPASERSAPGAKAPVARDTYVPPSKPGARVSPATVLHSVQASRIFSNPSAPDNFILQLRGPKVLSARLHLFVVSSRGDTLTHQVLPVAAVLPDETAGPATPARAREVAVLKGMNDFFAVSRFSKLPGAFTMVAFRYPSGPGQVSRLVYEPDRNRATSEPLNL